ncbi:MAG: tyrosine recombinase XerC [Thermodesulfobacteria bacterium]|nr:tyrosine recombinase XerC [Thermodesulfobacteriota bacterium]
MTFSNSLNQFLSFLESEKNLSGNTITAYQKDLLEFSDFLTALKRDFTEVEPRDVRKWLMTLSRRGLKRTSIARKLSSLRTFYKFLVRSGTVSANPAEPVTFPLRSRPLPKGLTIKEMEILLDSQPREDFIGIRDQAMLELLYSTGIRVSELTGLDLDDVSLEPEIIKVRGKGGKERIVPFGQHAKTALERYLKVRYDLLSKLKRQDEQALFLNSRGGRLTPRSVQRIVNQYGWRLTLSGNLTPHMFRHSMATHLLEMGADLRSIQKLLGHSSVSTTQIYTNLDVSRLKTVFSQCHPRARKK